MQQFINEPFLQNDIVWEDRYQELDAAALFAYTAETRRQILEERSCTDLIGRLQNQESLSEIELLKENWDGENAPPIGKDVVSNARKILAFFEDKKFSPIDLYPSTNGTVIFEWEAGFSRASLEVGKTKYSFYLKTPGEATEYAMGTVNENFDKMAFEIGKKIYELDENTLSTSTSL